MKKLLLMLIAIVIKMASAAQNPIPPTVIEGRIWNIVSIHPAEPPESESTPGYYKDIKGRWGIGFPHTLELRGDTIMVGVPYKKLFLDDSFLSGLREEDGRIYECLGEDIPEVLIFDFNLQPGDIFKDEFNDSEMEVKQVRTVSIDGTNRQCMDMWAYKEGVDIKDGLVDYWIGGIGCMNGPHDPFWWEAIGSQPLLLSCYDGDECIFSIEEFNPITNIKTAIMKYSTDNRQESYDLQGRKITTPSKTGMYIQNGKKHMKNI